MTSFCSMLSSAHSTLPLNRISTPVGTSATSTWSWLTTNTSSSRSRSGTMNRSSLAGRQTRPLARSCSASSRVITRPLCSDAGKSAPRGSGPGPSGQPGCGVRRELHRVVTKQRRRVRQVVADSGRVHAERAQHVERYVTVTRRDVERREQHSERMPVYNQQNAWVAWVEHLRREGRVQLRQ